MRLPTKPSQLPTSTGIFSIRLPNAMTVAMTSLAVALPRTFSISFMTLAGLKKWVPMTSWGRLVAAAISSMSRVEVLVASTAPGFITLSSSPKMVFFNSISSNTASITISADPKSA